jgi:hypothetical protein
MISPAATTDASALRTIRRCARASTLVGIS